MPARLPDHFWSSAALFLLPALSLVLPSGYSYAPALLIIVSLVNIRLWWGKVSLPKEAGYSTNGIANTSVGARLQMWQFGWDLYRAKPLFGWTQLGYMTEKRLAIDANRLDPMQAEFNHPHNELLDAASKRGTVGLLILVLAYAAPIFAFAHIFKSSAHIEARAISMAGMLIPIAFAAYGLTQSFLPHNSGATMYVYSLVLLCGASLKKKEILPAVFD